MILKNIKRTMFFCTFHLYRCTFDSCYQYHTLNNHLLYRHLQKKIWNM